MSISEQLRQAMIDDGRSRYRLAKETGIDMSTIHRFYWGMGGMSADGIDRLADVLGLELCPKQAAPAKKTSTKKGT